MRQTSEHKRAAAPRCSCSAGAPDERPTGMGLAVSVLGLAVLALLSWAGR